MVRRHHVINAASLFGGTPVRRLTDESSGALDLIRESGLVGMGGAGFPTWKKLSYGKGAKVVIANAAECEPLLEHNVARLETDAHKVLAGLTIATHIVGATRSLVAIKAKNAAAVRSVRRVLDAAAEGTLDDVDPSIEVVFLQDRYPAGDERAIVRDVLGTLLDASQIPGAAGAVVINVESLLRVDEAVVEHRAVTTKDLTVAGRIEGSGFPDDVSLTLFDVPIGTTIRAVLEALHIHPETDTQLLLGGPYMGTIAKLDDPVTETAGGIIIGDPEISDAGPMGIIVCACGPSEERLRAAVKAKGAPLAAVVPCKNVVRLPNGRLKCRNPGICPGQAQAVLALRKRGARSVLIGHCTDCSNTVMQIAPKLGMRVHHATDAFMRAGDEHLIRAFRKTAPIPTAGSTVRRASAINSAASPVGGGAARTER